MRMAAARVAGIRTKVTMTSAAKSRAGLTLRPDSRRSHRSVLPSANSHLGFVGHGDLMSWSGQLRRGCSGGDNRTAEDGRRH